MCFNTRRASTRDYTVHSVLSWLLGLVWPVFQNEESKTNHRILIIPSRGFYCLDTSLAFVCQDGSQFFSDLKLFRFQIIKKDTTKIRYNLITEVLGN